ncbi:hypothetical protein EV193_11631 [Herbihabitans rhizosphaerae]|uniref:Helix-turn-helix protein n=2 Tax=Herbihabitans rhizosphaerae TaxID=1872711 RepID=A0A4Q7KFR0_9PSEU|nr:hypothetical protein EV193_11631 [Herbihabitans rhizosphaerae]
MATRWGYRPRPAWRHAHGWTQDEVAARYSQVVGDSSAAMTGKRISGYEAWPKGGNKPSLTALLVLARIYDTQPVKLIDQYDRERFSRQERAALESSEYEITQLGQLAVPARSEPVAHINDGTASNRYGETQAVFDLIKVAAFESRRHAENAQVGLMSDMTIDELTAEVERLVKAKLHTSSLSLFPDLVNVRDRIYRLLEYRQYPRQQEQLYFLASVVCALLAGSSASVGFPRAAMEQARASWTYAEIIGHNSLRFKARMRQATLVDWDDRPQQALDLAISAGQWATEPIAKAQLNNAIAAYSARTSRYDAARESLVRAFREHESSPGDSELFDHLGGAFSYSRAKLLQVATETYIRLSDPRSAQECAVTSIEMYESGPSERRALGNETSARIDLGHARLLEGDLDGARNALYPVFELEPARRLEWVGLRLKDFSATLRRNNHLAVSSQGRQLASNIEEFFQRTASDEFPRLGA